MKRIAIALLATCVSAHAQDTAFFDQLFAQVSKPKASAAPAIPIQYYESVSMTGSNLPNPVVVTYDSTYDIAYVGYHAFQRDSDVTWFNTDNKATPHWIRYDCGSGNSNLVVEIMEQNNNGYGFSNVVFAGSMDGVTYSDLASVALAKGPTKNKISIASPGFYRYYRMTSDGTLYNGGGACSEIELSSADFSGPVMTSTNAPSPYVLTSDSGEAGYPVWRAFDRDLATTNSWGATAAYPHWVNLDMGSNVVINGIIAKFNSPWGWKNFSIEGSSDGITYVTNQTGTFADTAVIQQFTNANTTAYRYWRVTATNGYAVPNYGVYEITFKHYR